MVVIPRLAHFGFHSSGVQRGADRLLQNNRIGFTLSHAQATDLLLDAVDKHQDATGAVSRAATIRQVLADFFKRKGLL